MRRAALSALILLLLSAARPAQVRVRPVVLPDLREEARQSASRVEGEIVVPGLEHEVEVLRDSWGIPHIYAKSVPDLFMAQGFVAAQDRLWQMEMWRRTGEGKLAEILGPEAVARDRFARLMLYRGDRAAEWKSYSDDARVIIEAFVAGVNANIRQRRESGLPFEFRQMGIAPELWTPEVCLTRMAGYIMTRNASNELLRARLVRDLGLQKTLDIWPPDPPTPVEIPSGLSLDEIDYDALAETLATARRSDLRMSEGSNNWAVAGRLTASGRPILANDPHRTIAIPSLRYMAHLVGPGWNVIGAGEPSLPGVAAGHNEKVAFGFTIVGIDQQDLYVESLNPEDPRDYRHKDRWRKMQVIREEIRVRGREQPEVVELEFTIHGPVIHKDGRRAYALRWVGTEPGTSGYLAALAVNRAENWQEFLEALERWKVPSENFVYADVEGNIGWQAAGLAPVRRNWSGLLPVPGEGRYEWQGYLPLSRLPREYNPREGLLATANHNILPPGYRHALGYEWSSDWRFRRISEVLRSRAAFTVEDFQKLQHDEVSLPARELVPYLLDAARGSPGLGQISSILASWDFALESGSTAAAIYQMWVHKLVPLVWALRLGPDSVALVGSRATLEMAIRWIRDPSRETFGADPRSARDRCLVDALHAAIADLKDRFGPDPGAWTWGALHQAHFDHPMPGDDPLRRLMDRGPVPRGGDGTTVNATSVGSRFRQTSGASYRQILDVGDWDRSVAVNVPGQSGEPGSPHYDDLLTLWSEGSYHPLAFSRNYVEKVSRNRLNLKPPQR